MEEILPFQEVALKKVNEKLAINAAAAFVPGQEYQGSDKAYSARAGFILKLGTIKKPTLISFKEKMIIDNKISDLEKANNILKKKNDKIIAQNKKLLENLNKLEYISSKLDNYQKVSNNF